MLQVLRPEAGGPSLKTGAIMRGPVNRSVLSRTTAPRGSIPSPRLNACSTLKVHDSPFCRAPSWDIVRKARRRIPHRKAARWVESESTKTIPTISLFKEIVQHGLSPRTVHTRRRSQAENRSIVRSPAVQGRALEVPAPVENYTCV